MENARGVKKSKMIWKSDGKEFSVFNKKSWWKKLFCGAILREVCWKQENAIAIKLWRARNVENVNFLAELFLSGKTGRAKGSSGLVCIQIESHGKVCPSHGSFSIFPSLFLSKFLLNSFCECEECETYISWERTTEKFAPQQSSFRWVHSRGCLN